MAHMTRLRALALLAALLTAGAGVAIPLFQYNLLFAQQRQWLHVLLTTAISAGVAALLGAAAAVVRHPAFAALHVAAAPALAAAMGLFNTQLYLSLATDCRLLQAAFAGCATCACAATNSCTAAQLAADAGCGSCAALPADGVCGRSASWLQLLLPFTGVIEFAFIAAPAALSLLILLPHLPAVCKNAGAGGGSGAGGPPARSGRSRSHAKRADGGGLDGADDGGGTSYAAGNAGAGAGGGSVAVDVWPEAMMAPPASSSEPLGAPSSSLPQPVPLPPPPSARRGPTAPRREVRVAAASLRD